MSMRNIARITTTPLGVAGLSIYASLDANQRESNEWYLICLIVLAIISVLSWAIPSVKKPKVIISGNENTKIKGNVSKESIEILNNKGSKINENDFS